MLNVSEILQGIPANAVLRERLQLAADKLSAVEKEMRSLRERAVNAENENANLKNQIQELQRRNASAPPEEEFVEYRGALFRKRKEGGYYPDVYCVDCRTPMTSLGNVMPYRCGRCRRDAGFKGSELNRVIGELRREKG